MPKLKTHTNRAVDILTACGWQAGIVERKVSRIVSIDLFGFVDIVAVKPSDDVSTLGLQVTSAKNVAARVKKILQEPQAVICLQAGWRIEVWGIKDQPDKHGSILLARTFVYEDQNLRVVPGSLVVDA